MGVAVTVAVAGDSVAVSGWWRRPHRDRARWVGGCALEKKRDNERTTPTSGRRDRQEDGQKGSRQPSLCWRDTGNRKAEDDEERRAGGGGGDAGKKRTLRPSRGLPGGVTGAWANRTSTERWRGDPCNALPGCWMWLVVDGCTVRPGPSRSWSSQRASPGSVLFAGMAAPHGFLGLRGGGGSVGGWIWEKHSQGDDAEEVHTYLPQSYTV
jgi:hypothetical protein